MVRGAVRALFAIAVTCIVLAKPALSYADDTTSYVSTRNWAGYLAQNAYYTGVGALFQTPSADQIQRLGAIGSWIGIGGADSDDLIQAGVGVLDRGGVVTYSAWYEMLPAQAQTIPMTIGGGDWVRVDIHEVTFNLWQITIIDGTQVFQRQFPYASSHSSAEWIVEQPSLDDGREIPLQSANSANFAQMTAITNGHNASPAQLSPKELVLVGPRDQVRALPSAIGADGASFSVAVR